MECVCVCVVNFVQHSNRMWSFFILTPKLKKSFQKQNKNLFASSPQPKCVSARVCVCVIVCGSVI